MTLSAVLLAGGKSVRMGVDKAMVIFSGEPLWRRQLRTLRELDPVRIFVSVRKTPTWQPRDTEVLTDQPPSRGPISGIAAVLAHMQTSHLLVLAVDMPLIRAAHLRELWFGASVGCGVVPIIAERAEPLAAIYPKEATTEFETALANGRFSLQPLVRRLAETKKVNLKPVNECQAGEFKSINEPADLS